MAIRPPDDARDALPVDGYGPGFFRVGGQVLHGAVILDGRRVIPWDGLSDQDALAALAGHVDLLFLGMGADIAHPPAELLDRLETLGIMVEPMASAMAARSYNLTLSEGRRVACALLPL